MADNTAIAYKELYAHYLQESVSLREQLVQAQLELAALREEADTDDAEIE